MSNNAPDPKYPFQYEISALNALTLKGSSYYDEVILNRFSNVSHQNKFGKRDNNENTAGDQTVWDVASKTLDWTVNETPGALEITYNSGTDGEGTTGATGIQIVYLNTSFELVTAVHILGSDGSDTTTFTDCLGVNRAVLISTGSANKNTNAITLTDANSPSAGIQAYIPPGDSVTHQSIFHIPIGATFILKSFKANANKISGGGSPRVTFKMKVYNRLVQTEYTLITFTIDTAVENTVQREFPTGFPFTGRDIIFWTIDTDTDNTPTTLSYEGTLYVDSKTPIPAP